MICKACIGVVIALTLGSLAVVAAPRIEVDSDTYDFGTILEGFSVNHTFVLTNTGDETFVINRVRTTCGCTTMELLTDELRPGQSVELKASVNTTGFGGRKISKAIYIYSDDPKYPDGAGPDKLILRITGSVVRAQPYHVTPEDLSLDSYLLVDLRPATEYAAGHLLGAVNIEPNGLSGTLASLELSGSTVIFVYDETGPEARAVADGLAAGGMFAFSLNGGLAQWALGYGDSYTVPQNAQLLFDTPIMVPDRTPNVVHTSYLRRSLYVLVDLRSAQAFANGHLVGATNIPIEEFSIAVLREMVGDLPIDARIILYDAIGQSSDMAVQSLNEMGYANAKSLIGGFGYWQEAYGSKLVW